MRYILLVVAALCGCAPSPKPAPSVLDSSLPPVPSSCVQGQGRYDSLQLAPPIDSNIAFLLVQQWEIFGKQDVKYPPDASAGDVTHKGSDEATMWRHVQNYHLASCDRVSQARIANPDENERIAWSAYFISWIMVNAGVPTAAFEASGYASASKPEKLMSLDKNSLDKTISINLRMMGPSPWLGGGMDLELGLFSIKSGELLTPIVDYVTKVAAAAGISYVAAIKPFVGLITEGMDIITGQANDTAIEVGVPPRSAMEISDCTAVPHL